eukprot:107155-Chlamydomonas_euryale.AAC.2
MGGRNGCGVSERSGRRGGRSAQGFKDLAWHPAGVQHKKQESLDALTDARMGVAQDPGYSAQMPLSTYQLLRRPYVPVAKLLCDGDGAAADVKRSCLNSAPLVADGSLPHACVDHRSVNGSTCGRPHTASAIQSKLGPPMRLSG